MSDKGNTQNPEHHGNRNILLSKTESSHIIIDMDNITDTKLQLTNDDFDENKPSKEPNLVESDLPDVITVTKKNHNVLEKQTVEDNNKNKEEINNNTFIKIRVYETYYEQQQPREHPHQQFKQQSLRQHYQSMWAGSGGHAGDHFTYDPGTRNYFVKLVFTILMSMLVVTTIFIGYVITNDEMKTMFRRNSIMFFVIGIVLLLTCQYAMFLSPCSRVPPCNIIVLLLSVVAFSIIAANISSRYKTDIILLAALATTAVVFVCLLLACTKFDFTSWLLYVVVIGAAFSAITMIIFVVALMTGHYPKPLQIAVLIIGTLLQVVVLIMELQMILGGKSVELTEDDYALGAFMLYTSIMSLFLNILQLLGFAD